MPSGKVHDNIALLSIFPTFLIGMVFLKLNLWENIVLILAVIFSQLMFGPDLDLQSSQYKRWGILKWIWFPYRKIFRHRSSFSHGIIIGPIIRCLYFVSFIALLIFLTDFFIFHWTKASIICNLSPEIAHLVRYFSSDNFKEYFYIVIFGLFIGAAIHTLTDKVYSFFKNLL